MYIIFRVLFTIDNKSNSMYFDDLSTMWTVKELDR